MAVDAFRQEVEFLTPLFKEAEDAHRDFTARWSSGENRLGVKGYKETEEYLESLARFHSAQGRLEEAIRPALDHLSAGRPEKIHRALAYLSIRLRPHRSGYTGGALARALKRVPLEDSHLDHLRKIILDRATWPWASVRGLWRWIPRLRTPDFENALRSLSQDKTPWIARRVSRLIREYL
ncbi:MAG: hypothetical protein HY293_21645 [Planctomycetes bacterium]|nr:hypothetical protein [Planctomycetota bacterium]